MSILRHFYPHGANESIVWRAVMPGELDAFRDFSTGSLGRIVMTECSSTDSGGLVALFSTETLTVETSHLAIPIIEVASGEELITMDEGDEFELPVKSLIYGAGTVLFRHDPTKRIKHL